MYTYYRGGDNVAKASTASKNKYNAKAYDRIALQVAKGKREELREFAAKRNLSLNAYIKSLITQDSGIEL